MSRRMSLTVGLFTVVVLIGSWFTTPAFATFCQISSISYNYPQHVLPGQSFSTTVTVSGVCAPDDANYYSVRSDLNDISGFVLSDVSVPIGFSQGQNWTVNVQNQVTAPASSTSWQIQFAVYIFAAVGSGGTLDSAAFKPVTIQVGTTQPAQTSTSISVTTQTEAPPVMISSTTLTSTMPPNQTTETAQPLLDAYRGVAAVLVLILLVMIVVLIKQRQNKHNA